MQRGAPTLRCPHEGRCRAGLPGNSVVTQKATPAARHQMGPSQLGSEYLPLHSGQAWCLWNQLQKSLFGFQEGLMYALGPLGSMAFHRKQLFLSSLDRNTLLAYLVGFHLPLMAPSRWGAGRGSTMQQLSSQQ